MIRIFELRKERGLSQREAAKIFGVSQEIFFKSPLEKSPDENRGFCFYKTDSSLPYTIPQNGQTVYSPITVCLYV